MENIQKNSGVNRGAMSYSQNAGSTSGRKVGANLQERIREDNKASSLKTTIQQGVSASSTNVGNRIDTKA